MRSQLSEEETVPDSPQQQLHMLWPERLISSSPEPAPPDGYELRTFNAQDPENETGYLRLMHQAGFNSFDHDAVARTLQQVLPDGFFLIVHRPSGQIVATDRFLENQVAANQDTIPVQADASRGMARSVQDPQAFRPHGDRVAFFYHLVRLGA